MRCSLVLLLLLPLKLKNVFFFVYINCFCHFSPSQMDCGGSRTFIHSVIHVIKYKGQCKRETKGQMIQHCCTQVMVQISKHNKGVFWVVRDKLFSLCNCWLCVLLQRPCCIMNAKADQVHCSLHAVKT